MRKNVISSKVLIFYFFNILYYYIHNKTLYDHFYIYLIDIEKLCKSLKIIFFITTSNTNIEWKEYNIYRFYTMKNTINTKI